MKFGELALSMMLAGMGSLAQAGEIPRNLSLGEGCDAIYGLAPASDTGLIVGMWDTDCDGSGDVQVAGPIARNIYGVKGPGLVLAAHTAPQYGYTQMIMIYGDGTYQIMYDTSGQNLGVVSRWKAIRDSEVGLPRAGRPLTAR